MRASRSQAAQHMIAEEVCTRARPRYSQMPASGLSNSRAACSPSSVEAAEQRLVAGARQALVEECLVGRQHHGAIDVVLDLL